MAQEGVVKWFNDVKGFGFIEPEGGGGDIFAHYSAIQADGYRSLKQGSRVTFDVVEGPKGKLAQNICSLGGPKVVNSAPAAREMEASPSLAS